MPRATTKAKAKVKAGDDDDVKVNERKATQKTQQVKEKYHKSMSETNAMQAASESNKEYSHLASDYNKNMLRDAKDTLATDAQKMAPGGSGVWREWIERDVPDLKKELGQQVLRLQLVEFPQQIEQLIMDLESNVKVLKETHSKRKILMKRSAEGGVVGELKHQVNN